MENEKWIDDGQKDGDVDHRTPPENGEGPTSAEVVTTNLEDTERIMRRPMALWITAGCEGPRTDPGYVVMPLALRRMCHSGA